MIMAAYLPHILKDQSSSSSQLRGGRREYMPIPIEVAKMNICLNSPKGMNRLAYGRFIYGLGCRRPEKKHTVCSSWMSNFDEEDLPISPLYSALPSLLM